MTPVGKKQTAPGLQWRVKETKEVVRSRVLAETEGQAGQAAG